MNGGASSSKRAGGSSLDDLEDLTEEQVWEQIRRQDQQQKAQDQQAQDQQRLVEPSGSGAGKTAPEEAKVDLEQVRSTEMNQRDPLLLCGRCMPISPSAV